MPDILVATDSDAVYREIASVVDHPDTSIRRVRDGAAVRAALDARPADLVIADMQIGSMGGVAVALDLHLEADAGRIAGAPVLLVLDRRPDVFLVRRAGVEGWILKPLDPLRIRRAVGTLLAGGRWQDPSNQPAPVAVAPVAPAGSPGSPAPVD